MNFYKLYCQNLYKICIICRFCLPDYAGSITNEVSCIIWINKFVLENNQFILVNKWICLSKKKRYHLCKWRHSFWSQCNSVKYKKIEYLKNGTCLFYEMKTILNYVFTHFLNYFWIKTTFSEVTSFLIRASFILILSYGVERESS